MNMWHRHHTLPRLVPSSFDRLTKWTSNDPEQLQPHSVHNLRRTVLKQQWLESCPANSRLDALSHGASLGNLRLEIQVAALQDWRPSFLAGIAQFSSAFTEEDLGHFGHKLVTDLDSLQCSATASRSRQPLIRTLLLQKWRAEQSYCWLSRTQIKASVRHPYSY